MKKFIAITTALVFMAATAAAFAGPKGGSRSGGATGGNKMFQYKSTPPPKSGLQSQPTQPSGKTGTVQDLGVNPSAKTPADLLKTPSGTGPAAGAASPSGPQVPQSTAPAFGGGGGFGGSWMNWAILGYLFGRHTSPAQAKQTKPEEFLEFVPDSK